MQINLSDIFLIEVNFPKVSKIGTMLWKMKKVWKLCQFCCNFDELHSTFSPNCVSNTTLFNRSGHSQFYFLNKIRDLNIRWNYFVKQRAFLMFHGLLGVLRPIPTKNAVISSKLPTGEIRIRHC